MPLADNTAETKNVAPSAPPHVRSGFSPKASATERRAAAPILILVLEKSNIISNSSTSAQDSSQRVGLQDSNLSTKSGATEPHIAEPASKCLASAESSAVITSSFSFSRIAINSACKLSIVCCMNVIVARSRSLKGCNAAAMAVTMTCDECPEFMLCGSTCAAICTVGSVAESFARRAAFAHSVLKAAAAPPRPAFDGCGGIGLSAEQDFHTTTSSQDDDACTRYCSNRLVDACECASA